MSPSSPSFIVLLVLGILALQVMIWVPLLMVLKRKTQRMLADLQAELAASGEQVRLAPQPSLYRGATAKSGYPFAKGNGVAALTDRRLVIRKLVGAGVEIPTSDIIGVREDKWFQRAYVGKLHVIVKTKGDAEVGLIVGDHAAWMTALQTLVDR
jgi:hypothetical protein